jgi:hypothetical protein
MSSKIFLAVALAFAISYAIQHLLVREPADTARCSTTVQEPGLAPTATELCYDQNCSEMRTSNDGWSGASHHSFTHGSVRIPTSH